MKGVEMKNVKIVFELLLFPFVFLLQRIHINFLRKRELLYFTFILLFLTPNVIWAAPGESCSDAVTVGLNQDINTQLKYPGIWQGNSLRYTVYDFTAPSDGTVHIYSTSSPQAMYLELEDNNCGYIVSDWGNPFELNNVSVTAGTTYKLYIDTDGDTPIDFVYRIDFSPSQQATAWIKNAAGDSAYTDPSPYTNNSDATETLSISGATMVEVTVTGETEDEANCNYDYVEITDGGSNTRRFCGTINETYLATGPSVNLRFHSDGSVTRSGVSVTIAIPQARARNDSYQTPKNTELIVDAAHGLLSNDIGEGIRITHHTDPAKGSLSLNNNGSFTYRPPNDFTGSATFNYTITDFNGNTDQAKVTIVIGYQETTGGRDFSIRYQDNIRGDVAAIGNTVLCWKQNGICQESPINRANNQISLSKTDVSSATLTLPDGAEVKYARIYWQGRKKATSNNVAWDAESKQEAKKIYLRKGASGAYTPLTADTLDLDTTSSRHWVRTYSAGADASSVVTGPGTYYVDTSRFYTHTGLTNNDNPDDGLGAYGAWVLVVVYEVEGETHTRNVTIFDGFRQVNSYAASTVDINVSGFLTPKSDDVDSKLYVFTAEGDRYIGGDHFLMAGERFNTTLQDIGNPANNAFNSNISIDANRTPHLINNNGIDIQFYDVGTTPGADGIITNNETGANFRFTSTQDTYFPSLLVFSTNLRYPKLCYDFTYGQYGNFITVPDLTEMKIEGHFDANVPLGVKFFVRNTENSDITLENLAFNLRDINTSYASYRSNSTYRKVAEGPIEPVPDSGRETNATDDLNISIGAVGGHGYFYVYNSLDINASHPQPFSLPLHADVEYDLVVDFEGQTYHLGRQIVKLEDLDPCQPEPIYKPIYGAFNVVHRKMTRPGDPHYYYNLPTQVVGRMGNFLLESMQTGADENKSQTVSDNTAYVASTEVLDVSGFHYANANCLDPNATAASAGRVWTIIDSGEYAHLINRTDMNNSRFFNRAVRNAAFRISYAVDGNGSIITLEKLQNGKYKLPPYAQAQCSSCGDDNGIFATQVTSCMECLYGIHTRTLCSRDNFAIRPESYEMNFYDLNQSDTNQSSFISGNTPAPADLNLVAGYSYGIDINATDHRNQEPTPGYYIRDINASLIWSPGTHTVSGCNDDDNLSYGVNFHDGSTALQIHTPNIGRYALHLKDRLWTSIDFDSSYMQHHNNSYFAYGTDCVQNSHAVQPSSVYRTFNGCNIETDHTNVEYPKSFTDFNTTFYPYRFTIGNIPDQNGSRIYINTPSPLDKDMSYNINTTFYATGYDGTQLSNFVNNCFAQDLDMSLKLNYLAGKPTTATDPEPYLSYDLNDTNSSNGATIYTNAAMDANGSYDPDRPSMTFTVFGSLTAPLIMQDQNASRFIKDMNGSIQMNLGINYTRHFDAPLPPRKIFFDDFNVSYRVPPTPLYADMRNDHNITGDLDLNDTVTFIYGRAQPSLKFYDDITNISVNTPVSVVFYCEDNCTQFGIDINTEQTGIYGWYLNTKHHDGIDGNVSLKIDSVSSNNPVDATVSPANPSVLTFNGGTSNATDEAVTVTRNTNNLPLTVWIGLGNKTDRWFLFNDNGLDSTANLPSLFGTRFIGISGWTGHGKTGNVVEVNASRSKGRRMGW